MKSIAVQNQAELLNLLSDFFKLQALKVCSEAQSGHIGSACSSAELLTTLYFGGVLKYDPGQPQHPGRDRVLMRGHLGPLRYPIFASLGWIEESELKSYRKLGSILHGHESMHHVPGVDITPSGSLGMCLSYGTGAAIRLAETYPDATVYVFLGDGEEQEGNVGEAARHAASLGLKNLVCILDWNAKQLSRPTEETEPVLDRAKVWEGYGWEVRSIDGHNVENVYSTLTAKRTKPLFILARTIKGRGVPGAEDHPSGYHSFSTCPKDNLSLAIKTLEASIVARMHEWDTSVGEVIQYMLTHISRPPSYVNFPVEVCPSRIEPQFATSQDYDEVIQRGLRSLVDTFKNVDQRLVFVTADWSTKQQSQENGFFEQWVRYVDVGIREQHMMAIAHGMAVTDNNARIIVFDGDAFVYRFADQIHASAQANVPVVIITTDSGLCEARNGPTHQSEGQPGAIITMPGIRFFEPADEEDFYVCLNRALQEETCPTFIRTHSNKISQILGSREGEAYVCFESHKEAVDLTLVSSGCTVMYAIDAADRLRQNHGVNVRVINVLEPKDLGVNFTNLIDPKAPLLVVYNGNPSVLSSFVSRSLLMFGQHFEGRMYEHGFLHGTTGTMQDVFKSFQLDDVGIENVILKCMQG